MKKLLITTTLPNEGIQTLQRYFDVTTFPSMPKKEILSVISDHEVMIVRSETQVDSDIIHAGKHLKIIGRAGTGLDNIDRKSAEASGIKVMNTPDANSAAVAELIFGIMLSFYRNIREADMAMKQGTWEKSRYAGRELNGKTLGIIGFGRIGKMVARIAKAFGMNLRGFDAWVAKEEFREMGVEKENTLHDIVSKADIITLHVPKTPETAYLIGKKELQIMKKTALLINASRGGIVDEEALLEALKTGGIGGAGIDTWEQEPEFRQELARQKNVIALPHLGASTKEAEERCVSDLIAQIFAFYGY